MSIDGVPAAVACLVVRDAPVMVVLLSRLGDVVWANDFALQTIGLTLDAVRGRPWCEACAPLSTQETLRTHLLRAAAAREPSDFIHPVATAAGDLRDVKWRAIPVASSDNGGLQLLAVGLDVSAESGAMRDLALSETRYKTLFEANPQPMIVFDRHTLRVLSANAAASRSYGYSRPQFMHLTMPDLKPPYEAERLRKRLDDATVVSPAMRAAGRWRHRDARGVEMVVDISAQDVQWNGHQALMLLMVDVTASVAEYTALEAKAELLDRLVQQRTRDLEAARDAAHAASQAKTVFLARMSHELRTPLNGILGFTEVLQHRGPMVAPTELQHHLQMIYGASKHLEAMINDVLDLGTIELGAVRAVSEIVGVADVVHLAIEDLQSTAGAAGISLRSEVPAACVAVADRTRLRQVLGNLVSNGIKYGREHGTVTVSAGCSPEHDDVLWLCVADDGPGIAAKDLQRLFVPFERLRSNGQVAGTGIGLALAKQLMHAMGGDIDVQSTVGHGTRFTLQLRRAPPSVRSAETSQAQAHGAQVSLPSAPGRAPGDLRNDVKGTVLFVDDDQVNLELMKAFLILRPGVHLILAEDVAQALHAVSHQPVHLVICDMMLREASGIDLRQALLAALHQQPTPPMVAYSANALPADIDAALAAGFDAYLVKPVDLRTLLAEIDKQLEASQ